MNDQRRRRDDEPTVEVIVDKKPAAPIAAYMQIDPANGQRITSMIEYQLISFRLRERPEPCWLIVLNMSLVSSIVVAYVFKTSDFAVGSLQTVTFELNGEPYSYAPALREKYTRDFLQKSGDFFSPSPPIVIKPSIIKRYASVIDLDESRTIPPPNTLPIVKESGNVCGILSMREAEFLSRQRKALKDR